VCGRRGEQQLLETRRAAASEALTQHGRPAVSTIAHLRHALLADEASTRSEDMNDLY
jgi:hypothetical protein